MAQLIPLLIAVFKAFPTLEIWWERLIVAYVEHQKDAIRKWNKDAIRKALDEDDQRPIEIQLGSQYAGKPSGNPGTVIVDSLPGVHHKKGDSSGHLVE